MSRKLKFNVTVISKTRRTIFQLLRVLINYEVGYIASLFYLRNLIFCYVEAPMNIRVLPSDNYVLTPLTATDFFRIRATQSIAFISVGCMRKRQ